MFRTILGYFSDVKYFGNIKFKLLVKIKQKCNVTNLYVLPVYYKSGEISMSYHFFYRKL